VHGGDAAHHRERRAAFRGGVRGLIAIKYFIVISSINFLYMNYFN
jgi:hypothetical protein